jgi:hypothetical protein
MLNIKLFVIAPYYKKCKGLDIMYSFPLLTRADCVLKTIEIRLELCTIW